MPRQLLKLDQRAMRRNIKTVLDRGTPSEILAFGPWYVEANRECQDISIVTGLPVEVVAAVMSALSPQLSWGKNKDATWDLLTDDSVSAVLTTSVDKARRMLVAHYGNQPILPVFTEATYSRGSKKTVNFWRNLCGDVNAVTIDRHAVAIALGPDVDGNKILNRVGAYEQIADAYRAVAKARGLQPCQVQAITWCIWRGSAD